MKIRGKFSFIQLHFILLALQIVHCEELIFNGTHSMNLNQTKVEVTTVRIAEVFSLKNNSTGKSTVVVKEKTAKHFITSTPNTKAVLIPPAKIGAQIMNKKKANTT